MFGDLSVKVRSGFAAAQKFAKGAILFIDPTQPDGKNSNSGITWNGSNLTGLANPANGADASNKTYTDAGDASTLSSAEAYALSLQGSFSVSNPYIYGACGGL